MADQIIKTNKFSGFKYFIEKRFEAGIVLSGSDVKAIRANLFEIRESFVRLDKGELFLWNIILNSGNLGSQKRKLLLHKTEISKITEILQSKKNHGFVLSVIYNEKKKIKIELGFGSVKKSRDQKSSEKRMTEKRILEKQIAEET